MPTPPFAVTASYQTSQYGTGDYSVGGSQVFSHLATPPTSGTAAEAASATDAVASGFSAYSARNEVNVVTLTGSPTGGTFRLGFGGLLTGNIAYNASAATVATAVRALANIPITTAGINDVQVVTLTGGATGGTFTLTFGGQTTSALAFNATGATVQTAFLALSSVGAGNATVTGSAGGPYTITFIGTLGSQSPGAVTGSAASLTGGTPVLTVTHPTTGAAIVYSVAVTGSTGGPWTVTFSGKFASKDLAQLSGDSRSLTGGTFPKVVVSTTAQGRSAFVNDALADGHRQQDRLRDQADSASGNHF